MKARNWLFLASFLIMMEGAMDISIYFIQYMWLGLRYVPNVPAQIRRANVLCIVYGGYGICLFIVGFLGIIFRENPRRLPSLPLQKSAFISKAHRQVFRNLCMRHARCGSLFRIS